MKATEQLSGLEMMAVDPVKRILTPRFFGGFVAMPVLVALFSAVGVLRGYFVGVSRATTRTVVHSSLAVLGLDFVLTALMFGE